MNDMLFCMATELKGLSLMVHMTQYAAVKAIEASKEILLFVRKALRKVRRNFEQDVSEEFTFPTVWKIDRRL